MITPQLKRWGRALPVAWQKAILRRARGLDLPAIVADLFLDYPPGDRGFDPVRTKWNFFWIEQIAGRYFRTTTIGAENIPDGRALIVGCHGGVMPWDAILLMPEIYRLTLRFSWYAGHEFWGRYAPLRNGLVPTGLVLGGLPEFEELLRRGELCTIFPDGGQGMRRSYFRKSERYRVKPDKGFAPARGGYIKLALRTRSPIVPVAIVGVEEIHYCLANLPRLARRLGVPVFPLIASVFPLPARVYIRFGEAIRFPAPPEAADDQAVVDRLNEQVRGALQALIDDTLRRRKGVYWSSYDASDGNRVRTGRPGAPPTTRREARGRAA
jgi:1-acyl-sn-glycerol-3-phosphate acyltransferase